jgi:H+/gluconate symporter-like permease
MYACRLAMPSSIPLLPMFLALGTLFGALAAASAYVISYGEYRQRMLRPGQRPRRMALETAIVTFAVFFVAAVVLSFVLAPGRS